LGKVLGTGEAEGRWRWRPSKRICMRSFFSHVKREMRRMEESGEHVHRLHRLDRRDEQTQAACIYIFLEKIE
jgi:hypothetical protein